MDALLSTLVITGIVAIVTQLVKKFKLIAGLGDYGIQILVLVFAIIVSLFEFGWTFVPVQYADTIITVWAGAIAWYEIVISKLTRKG
jgi:hypothetical protein